MAHENLLADVATLLEDIVARPEDRMTLHGQLSRKVAEMRKLGLPVRAELLQYEDDPEDDADDDFDNMPI
ncbi:MAG: hypothetical protein CSA74_08330 [Rhodobacterales bacterium]|nr:MAG: hypothetical protein CSA74_08330 [Rhodobacterales bacterium]